jgi:glucokinase
MLKIFDRSFVAAGRRFRTPQELSFGKAYKITDIAPDVAGAAGDVTLPLWLNPRRLAVKSCKETPGRELPPESTSLRNAPTKSFFSKRGPPVIIAPASQEFPNFMSESFALGVDVGGTKVAAGLVNASGAIVKRARVPMIATGDADKGLAAVLAAVGELIPGSGGSVRGIGICSPGPLNPRTGVIINPPNVPCWRNFPLAERVRGVYNVPVKVDNDANAAGLAEVLWGAARGHRNVFYATVGTGIGSGIILDGKILHGRTGAAGEAGHMGIDIHGPRCPCGKKGCVEVLASGPAIGRRARKKLAANNRSIMLELAGGDPQAVNGEIVSRAAQQGDALAREVIDETLDILAYWLGNVIDYQEPELIVMGGGVSTTLAPYLEDIRRRWIGNIVNPWPQDVPLVLAHYGEEAGIAGAAALCK